MAAAGPGPGGLAPPPCCQAARQTGKGTHVGEVLQQGWALLTLLVFGGLLAALSALLPRLGKEGEGRLAEGAMAPPEFPGPPRTREIPPPPPPAAPVRPAPAPSGEDEALLAAAVGLALILYEQEGHQTMLPSPAPEPAASPWVLAGRWQAMHRRLSAHRR